MATLANRLSPQMNTAFDWRCCVRLYSQRDVNGVVKASNARLISLLGLNEPGSFTLKPRALEIYTKSILPIFCKWNKAQMISCLFITWFADNFKPIIDTY